MNEERKYRLAGIYESGGLTVREYRPAVTPDRRRERDAEISERCRAIAEQAEKKSASRIAGNGA